MQRRGISLDSITTEKQEVADLDDSGEFTVDELTTDELVVLADVANEINPKHVPVEEIPEAKTVSIIAAMARHEYSDIARADVEELCDRIGLSSDQSVGSSSNENDLPAQVLELICSAGSNSKF